jgi:hypothetical protein
VSADAIAANVLADHKVSHRERALATFQPPWRRNVHFVVWLALIGFANALPWCD